MDLGKIHYFIAAAELQNFTKAAKACHIAQTTMSKYITVLEQEMGCRLFLRAHRTARLTVQGERFYEGIKKIYEQYQDLCQEISRTGGSSLRIGMLTIDYEDFPVLRSFELSHPDISVYFSFGEEAKLLADLQRRRLDALICPNILSLQHCGEKQRLVREDLVTIEESLVCSRELLERFGSIGAVIAGQPFITKTSDNTYQNFCRAKLQELYGSTFSETLIASSFSQQLLLLNLSRGFAIIPSLAGAEYENLIFFPTPEIFSETAQLLYQQDFVTESLQALLKHIHEKKC